MDKMIQYTRGCLVLVEVDKKTYKKNIRAMRDLRLLLDFALGSIPAKVLEDHKLSTSSVVRWD